MAMYLNFYWRKYYFNMLDFTLCFCVAFLLQLTLHVYYYLRRTCLLLLGFIYILLNFCGFDGHVLMMSDSQYILLELFFETIFFNIILNFNKKKLTSLLIHDAYWHFDCGAENN